MRDAFVKALMESRDYVLKAVEAQCDNVDNESYR